MRNMNCIQCGKPRQIGRRVCPECYTEMTKARAKLRYAEGKRTVYNHECRACDTKFRTTRRTSVLCTNCLAESKTKQPTTYAYSKIATGRLIWQHRVIAEHILGRRLLYNEAIHHVDGDGTNNELSNLWLLSGSAHSKLHAFLRVERIVFLKRGGNEHKWRQRVRKLSFQWKKVSGEKAVLLSKLTDESYIDEDVTEPVQRHKAAQIANCKARKEAKAAREATRSKKRKVILRHCIERKVIPRHCIVCGTVLTSEQKAYCSQNCSHTAARKTKWPSPEKLRRLLWKYPTTHIAQHYGVSGKAVEKWCKKYNIEKPPRGYWAKLRSTK